MERARQPSTFPGPAGELTRHPGGDEITFAADAGLDVEVLAKVLKLDPARLYVTVFAGEGVVPADTEAAHRRSWQHMRDLFAEVF